MSGHVRVEKRRIGRLIPTPVIPAGRDPPLAQGLAKVDAEEGSLATTPSEKLVARPREGPAPCGARTRTLTNHLSQTDPAAKICVSVLTAFVSEGDLSR